MRIVVQRVSRAEVTSEGKLLGKIGKGFCCLIGVCEGDTKEIADKLVKKLTGLRIFSDENGKTNLALSDVKGGLLLISQFTLYADCKKGNRPSFTRAGSPEAAEALYDYVVAECRRLLPGLPVETGSFGASMQVSISNEGPFTILLDSAEIC